MATSPGTISDTERLPWLDLSRDVPLGERRRKAPAPAARRLVPLGIAVAALFVAGVGYISYRLGQDDGAAAIAAREPASATVALPRPAPVIPAAEPTEAGVATPPSRADVQVSRPVARRARPRVLTFDTPSGQHPYPPEAKSVADPATPPLLSAAPVIAPVAAIPAPVPRRRAGGPIAPRGQILNVGSYRSPAFADLAWARMVQRYPYLAQLKRQVTPFYYRRANRTYWRLDLAAPRRSDSKKLCGYIKQIGYGCTIA